jgi:hypothetical protein
MDRGTNLGMLLEDCLGAGAVEELAAAVVIPGGLKVSPGETVSRAELAFALNLMLFRDLLERAPSARAYVLGVREGGGKVFLDHGALRTVLAPCGALPPGEASITRILEPLGYLQAETYPLDRLSMTGRAYRHRDLPEEVPQFFLSEFHPEGFSEAFRAAASRVLATSREPLAASAMERLRRLASEGALPHDEAGPLLSELAACFGRQHEAPDLSDYRILLRESAEMAWIATEGSAFNHATDRVPDVEALAGGLKALGRPMKETVEVSASGRVHQTAFQADPVERAFGDGHGGVVKVEVPGSFFEFITRHPLPGGGLDLGFDTSNAQAIFRMTAARKA